MGGWRFGNTIDGCQAEYVLVPYALANLAPIPDGLTDEQVLMCPDIMSTGFGGAETRRGAIGDTVAVFAQGPIGLCVTAGARLRGAAPDHRRRWVQSGSRSRRRSGADRPHRLRQQDPVEAIWSSRAAGGRRRHRGARHAKRHSSAVFGS